MTRDTNEVPAGGRSGTVGEPEGIVRYWMEHAEGPLPPEALAAAAELDGWRRVMRRLGVLGRDPARYGGYGFGNASRRVAHPGEEPPPGCRRFVVSGTQTAHLEELGTGGWALVEWYEPAAMRLASRGPVAPSSEALTHAALYDADPAIGCVLHAHAPEPWRRAGELGLPTTPAATAGTAEMAAAVAETWRRLGGPPAGLFVLGGHQDGLVAFGPDPRAAGERLVAVLAAAWSATARATAR